MEYRTFGKTGRKVSVLTLGGMRFLRCMDAPFDVYPEESLEHASEMVSEALALGINLFETAWGYGKSEGLYGHALKQSGAPRDSYQVMSKVTPTDDAAAFRRKLDQSLRRLDLDKLDYFAFHGLNWERDYQRVFRKGGCFEEIDKARAEGLIDCVGFSTHGWAEMIVKAIDTDAFDFVNLHYYRFRQANRVAIDRAGEKKMGVLIISPNDQGGRLHAAPEGLRAKTAPLAPAQHNEQWLLAHPEIHTLTVGASEKGHFKLHLDALKPQPEETVQGIEAQLAAASAASPVGQCLACQACLPCPQEINIPEIFRLQHLEESFGLGAFVGERYTVMGRYDPWTFSAPGNACDDCGDCLPRCPAKLDIPTLLRAFHAGHDSRKKRIWAFLQWGRSHLSEETLDRVRGLVQAVLRRWL